jgi:hypothetical protein
MKKIFFPAIASIALLFIAGCSEKFKVAAPYKNITVIYAMLDQADTPHYVRIQKAFLDESKSAVTMAQTPDSSFYSALNVRIARIDYQGRMRDTIHLDRVDLNHEGYPKQTGTFFNAPNYAYKFTQVLDGRYIYRIYATNPATGETDSADAPVIEDRDPSIFYVDKLDTNTIRAGLDFTNVSKNVEIFSLYYTPAAYNFSFEGQSGPAYFAQLVIGFNWWDSSITTHQKTQRHYDYNAGFLPCSGASAQADYVIKDIQLYSALATAMANTPANTVRLLDRCDLTMYLGTLDYYQYYQTSLTQGTGLTGSEIEPIATNVKGANALGLYTSKGYRTGKITMVPSTVDSLIASPLLSSARIVGTVYH